MINLKEYLKDCTPDEIIDKILDMSIKRNVLCRFADGQHRVGRLEYKVLYDYKNREKIAAVIPIFCIGNIRDAAFSRREVTAFEDLVDENNITRGWHGDFTDGTDPKKGEECVILIQELRGYDERLQVDTGVYDGKANFYGYSTTSRRSVIGFKHINPNNGMPF